MKQDHIIQKVFVEITVNNKEKALNIKDDINVFLSTDVFPAIEKHINALEHQLAGHTLQISRLELNLDVTNSSLNTELKDKIAQLFKEEVSEIITPILHANPKTENDSDVYLINNQEKRVEAFIYFLERGSLPWWNSDRKGVTFLEPTAFDSLILTPNFVKSILPVLSKQSVQDRMISQLSNGQIAQLCAAILKDKELKISLEADIIRFISKLSYNTRIIVWRLVLNVVSEYFNPSNKNLREYLLQQIATIETAGLSQIKNSRQNWKTVARIFPFMKENEIFECIKNNAADPHENAATSMETIRQNERVYQKDTTIYDAISKDNEQYIQNAGLILIHPFIKTFFEDCSLLHPNTQQLLDPELGAHLLHYIATGNTNAPEYDMVFEKFLCNIPVNQTINRHIKLSHKHKAQAKKVIESVQHNWPPMKAASAALLQNEFFQRSGKLVATDYDYNLTIERKAQDILLDKLAWGIGLFKLPWQEKFIFVNW